MSDTYDFTLPDLSSLYGINTDSSGTTDPSYSYFTDLGSLLGSPDSSWSLSDLLSGLAPSDAGNVDITSYIPSEGLSDSAWNTLLDSSSSGTSLSDLLGWSSLDTPSVVMADSPYISSGGETFVKDSQGNVVGYVDADGNIQYYSNIEGYRTNDQVAADPNPAGSQSSGSYADALKALLQQQAMKQISAKTNYANSGVGQALSGLSMAAMLAQALTGKNQGATTSSRSNQGQTFAPTYQAATAPKTLHGMKKGGHVNGALLQLAHQKALQMAMQKGLISGMGGGQDDVVDIKGAPGEYMMDAESVSALGDGSNEEGARKLDQMRRNIRKHKRSGPLSSIPPKAKQPEEYLGE